MCMTQQKQEPAGPKQAKKKLPVHIDPSQGKKTQWKKGQSGNPAGTKPGTKQLSTHIRSMLADPEFINKLNTKVKGDLRKADPTYQDIPVKAIIATAIIRAIKGERDSREWLAKYGFGTKIELSGPDDGPIRALVEFVGDGAGTGTDSGT